MAKYRKKPVVIDAVNVQQILWDAGNHWAALPQWVKDAYEAGDIIFLAEVVHIKTLEGTMVGHKSDMLIRGVQGEIYPCKREIFAETYEYVE